MATDDVKPQVLSSGIEVGPFKGKRRKRSHYFKRITVKGGDMIWVRTELLPSDREGMMYYLDKGFRLDPPEGTEWAKDLPPKPEDPEKVSLREKIAVLEAQLLAAKTDPMAEMFGKEGQVQ